MRITNLKNYLFDSILAIIIKRLNIENIDNLNLKDDITKKYNADSIDTLYILMDLDTFINNTLNLNADLMSIENIFSSLNKSPKIQLFYNLVYKTILNKII